MYFCNMQEKYSKLPNNITLTVRYTDLIIHIILVLLAENGTFSPKKICLYTTQLFIFECKSNSIWDFLRIRRIKYRYGVFHFVLKLIWKYWWVDDWLSCKREEHRNEINERNIVSLSNSIDSHTSAVSLFAFSSTWVHLTNIHSFHFESIRTLGNQFENEPMLFFPERTKNINDVNASSRLSSILPFNTVFRQIASVKQELNSILLFRSSCGMKTNQGAEQY